MNQEFDAYIHEESDSTRIDGHRWNTPLVWTVLLILGFLVYEITARPAYGITIVCVKFGWNYFRSAWWLLRTDPNRRRGWACFWLYLGAALAKTAFTASIIMLGLAILAVMQLPNVNVKEFFLAYATAIVAFALSGLGTTLALVQGARRKIKLWLDPGVEWAREQNSWPPVDAERFHRNRISWLLVTALIFFFLPLHSAAGYGVFFAAFGRGQRLIVDILGGFLLGAPLVCLPVIIDFIKRRVIAKTPQECWGGVESKYAPP